MNSVPPYLVNQPPPPPKRTGWIVYAVIVTFFLFLSVLANLVLFAAAFSGGASQNLTMSHRSRYEEHYVTGEEDARDKIAVIYVTGVINSSEDGYNNEEARHNCERYHKRDHRHLR